MTRVRVDEPNCSVRVTEPNRLLPTVPDCRIFAAVVHRQTESDMKGLEKKKEAKKKPQKSLKEKRAEKHAKKAEHS